MAVLLETVIESFRKEIDEINNIKDDDNEAKSKQLKDSEWYKLQNDIETKRDDSVKIENEEIVLEPKINPFKRVENPVIIPDISDTGYSIIHDKKEDLKKNPEKQVIEPSKKNIKFDKPPVDITKSETDILYKLMQLKREESKKEGLKILHKHPVLNTITTETPENNNLKIFETTDDIVDSKSIVSNGSNGSTGSNNPKVIRITKSELTSSNPRPGDNLVKPGDNLVKPGDTSVKPGDTPVKPVNNPVKQTIKTPVKITIKHPLKKYKLYYVFYDVFLHHMKYCIHSYLLI